MMSHDLVNLLAALLEIERELNDLSDLAECVLASVGPFLAYVYSSTVPQRYIARLTDDLDALATWQSANVRRLNERRRATLRATLRAALEEAGVLERGRGPS